MGCQRASLLSRGSDYRCSGRLVADDYVTSLLARIRGGRVLDVGTGSGRFVRFLAETLASYEEIIGVDSSAEALAAARAGVVLPGVSFVRADAAALPFPDGMFHTVASSNSLHHLADISQALSEMLRVLRSGGRLILAEMVAGAASPAQRLHHELHRLLADINRRSGISHNPTMTRTQLNLLYRSLPLDAVSVLEVKPAGRPVFDPESLEFVRRVRQGLAAVRQEPEYQEWRRRAEELFGQIRRHGIQAPNQLWLIGTGL